MGYPGFVGVLLVVRCSSSQSEIVFQHPFHSNSTAAGSSAHRSSSSGPLPRRVNAEDKRQQEDLPEKQLPPWYPRHNAARLLAKLLLPTDMMFQNGFELSIDASSDFLQLFPSVTETSHQRLRFLCYPCFIQRGAKSGIRTSKTETSNPTARKPQSTSVNATSTLPSDNQESGYDTVEWISIVFAFDSRGPGSTDGIFRCAATLAEAFKVAEEKYNHVSIDVSKINKLVAEFKYDEAPPTRSTYKIDVKSSDAMNEAKENAFQILRNNLIDSVSLCRCMYSLFEQLRQSGKARIVINDWLVCHLDTLGQKTSENTTNWSCDGLMYSNGLPQKNVIDSRMLLKRVNDSDKLGAALAEAVNEWELPLENIVKAIQHLVYWKYSKIIDSKEETRAYVLRKSIQELRDTLAFRDFSDKFSLPANYLIGLISLFDKPIPLKQAKEYFCKLIGNNLMHSRINIDDLFDWLVATQTIYPLTGRVLFLPILINQVAPPQPTIDEPDEATPYREVDEPHAASKQTPDEQLPSACPNCFVFQISSSTTDAFCAVLRSQLTDSLYVQHLANGELLHVYLFAKEQLCLACDDTTNAAYTQRSTEDHSPTFAATNVLNKLERTAHSTSIWRNSDELEKDLLEDLEEFKGVLPPLLSGCLIFLIDFTVACIRFARDDAASTMKQLYGENYKALFSRLNNIVEETKFMEESFVTELISGFFVNKRDGVLSDCYCLCYS